MQHRNKFILKTREGRRLPTSSAYITDKQNECVTMHRARILQKDRMRYNAQKRREFYKAIQARTNALRFTETVRISQSKASAVLQQTM